MGTAALVTSLQTAREKLSDGVGWPVSVQSSDTSYVYMGTNNRNNSKMKNVSFQHVDWKILIWSSSERNIFLQDGGVL